MGVKGQFHHSNWSSSMDKFMSYVWIVESGCWLWVGDATRKGYANFRPLGERRVVAAHRWSYKEFVGGIPDGRIIDHKCHVRSCVNPDHLRVATHQQNSANRKGPQAGTASGVRGVSRHTKSGRWVVLIRCGGKSHYGGLFDDLNEAAQVAEKMRLELFGAFSGGS